MGILTTKDFSSAIKASKIGSIASGIYALYFAYVLLMSIFGPPIENATENPSVRLAGHIFLGFLTSVCIWATWRIYSGKGWITCIVLIIISALILLGTQGQGVPRHELIAVLICLIIFVVFGLRGTLGYRKFSKELNAEAFD